MELKSIIESLAVRIRDHSETIATEEACKTSVVLPFLQALGYEVFNPEQVVPEFTADTVGKKGEKVDYAIRIDGKLRLLIECKGLSTQLSKKHLAQLSRYFHTTEAKFAILTNGRNWEFYSDLVAPNLLDVTPFFSLDLLDVSSGDIAELDKFQKVKFNISDILADAERLKHVHAVKTYLEKQMVDADNDFVKLVASAVYEGRVTGVVRGNFQKAIRSAFKELVRDQVQSRLSSALASSESPEEEPIQSDIETTQDEIEAMMTIRSILSQVIAPSRIGLRDSKSYCAILIDDNNRKPLARLHFNGSKKYLGIFDGKAETRHLIGELTDIFFYGGELRETAERYLD